MPPREPFAITICQYGVLHVEHYDQGSRVTFEQAARQAGLIEIDRCDDQFSEGPVPGRQFLV